MMILSVIVGALIIFGVGMVYYKLLGETWARAYHFKMEELEATSMHMIGAAAVSLLIAIGLCMFIMFTGMNDLIGGIQVGLYAWLFFAAPTQFSGVIWANKPFQGFLIDTGCNALSFIIAGAVIGVML